MRKSIMSNRHRVVIIGGGFGGLYAAQALKHAPVDVTLLDRRNFHLFQPLLYQVATGALSPGEIASPLRSVLRRHKNTRVLLGEALDILPDRRTLIYDGGEIEYDSLIVAPGSHNSYFGHADWEEHAPGLKTIEEATQIRQRILYAFEAAERAADPEERKRWLTFVFVGAGPTGVELSGALGEIARDTLREDFRSIRPEEARIMLLDNSPRILPTYDPKLSEAAERSLAKLGVLCRNNVKVTCIHEHGVTLETQDKHQERIDANTVIWAAGVRPSPLGEVLARRCQFQLAKGNQVPVLPDCTVPDHPEIFVIGDLARFEQDAKPLPGVAQVAMQEGEYAAKTIVARLEGRTMKPFRYFDKGNLAVIGRGEAVAEIGKLRLHGLIAWLVWLFVHLMYLVEFSNRILVFVHWGFLYLTFNRGARLITGESKLLGEIKAEEVGPAVKN